MGDKFDYERGLVYSDSAKNTPYSPMAKPGHVIERPVQNKDVEPLLSIEIDSKQVMTKPGRNAPARVLGLGRPVDKDRLRAALTSREGLGDVRDLILHAKDCPVWAMPVIEQVRWTILGPMTQPNVNASFGAEIDLFGAGKNPPGIDFVETTMAMPGILQTHTLACAIGFHVSPEPLCFTVQGNAWTHPTAGIAQPMSPDVFTQNDRANNAMNAAITAGTQVFLPAVYEHGWWANYALWHLVRAYNLRWRIGQHTNIIDEDLRQTAFMPQNAQDGSASSSQVDVIDFIRRANDRYDTLGSALNFLYVNALRIGSSTVAGANIGLFRPSRALELVGATFGGTGLRALLKNNSEFRVLTVPYFIGAGIPIGLVAQESDNTQGNIMRRYLDVTQGQGGAIPPQITAEANINAALTDAGVAGSTFAELTLDAAPIRVTQRMDAQRVVIKGGDLKVTLPIKGFEVDADWYKMLDNDATLRRIVLNETGLGWASMGR